MRKEVDGAFEGPRRCRAWGVSSSPLLPDIPAWRAKPGRAEPRLVLPSASSVSVASPEARRRGSRCFKNRAQPGWHGATPSSRPALPAPCEAGLGFRSSTRGDRGGPGKQVRPKPCFFRGWIIGKNFSVDIEMVFGMLTLQLWDLSP